MLPDLSESIHSLNNRITEIIQSNNPQHSTGSKQYSNIRQHSEKIAQVLLSSFSRARMGRHDLRAQGFFPGGFMSGITWSGPALGLPRCWCPGLKFVVRPRVPLGPTPPPHLHRTAPSSSVLPTAAFTSVTTFLNEEQNIKYLHHTDCGSSLKLSLQDELSSAYISPAKSRVLQQAQQIWSHSPNAHRQREKTWHEVTAPPGPCLRCARARNSAVTLSPGPGFHL